MPALKKSQSHVQTLTLPIEGMTCASCSARVQRALSAVPGVARASVNLMTERAEVTMAPLDRAALVRAVQRSGFTVPQPAPAIDLAIEGMTCASCVGRVERALSAVPGAASVSVNLATERAHVIGSADLGTLIGAVAKIGFQARPITPRAAPANPAERRKAEAKTLRRDLIAAAALSLPVIALEMGSHAIPALHHWIGMTFGGWERVLAFALTSAVLAGPGRRFYRHGIPALLRGAPDMNSLVAVGTLAAWGYSTVATFAPAILPQGSAQVYFEAAASIVTLILLGRWLEARAKGRSASAIARLIGLQPRSAHRHAPDGTVSEVPLALLTTGDLVDIRPGARMPVDGIVTEGASWVDESAITGEPAPVRKSPGDPVTGGTVNQAGALTVRVEAVGEATVLAQIIRMVESAQAGKLPIQALVDRVTLWFVPVVMALAVLTFAIWMLLGPEPRLGYALVNAVAVLIVACPCAMGLATPVSIMVGTGRGAELGVLFRQGEALQTLADVRSVALDKTGTLTEGRPSLIALTPASGLTRAEVLSAIAAIEQRSEHPIARAIVDAATAEGLPLPPVEEFRTVTGRGTAGTVGGRAVLIGSAALLDEAGIAMPPTLASEAEALAARGLTSLFAAIDGHAAAVLAVADPVKRDTPDAIAALHRLGLGVAMISGDNPRTAKAVAAPLGIDHVVAGVMPAGKVAALGDLARPLAFIGDGINDAPALAEADVGIAIGTGTDIAIEAADVVLMSGSLSGVPAAIGLSRAVMRNIRQNLFWAFAYNAALVPVAMGALYPRWELQMSPILAAAAMALSSVFVLGNALRLRGWRSKTAHGG